MSKGKRSTDAWGIAFASIHQARFQPMTSTRLALTVIVASALVLVVAEGVMTWSL